MKRYIKKEYLERSLLKLQKIVIEKSDAHFSTIHAGQNIPQLLQQTIAHVSSLNSSFICYEYNITPSELFIEFSRYLDTTKPPQNHDEKSHCVEWVKKIQQVLEYCLSIPQVHIRTTSCTDIKRTLQQEYKRRESLQQKIASLDSSEENVSLRRDMEEELCYLEQRIAKLRNDKEISKNESMIEKDWEQRIDTSFSLLLQQTTDIQCRKESLETERNLFLYGIIPLVIVLLIWMCQLYGTLKGFEEININTYTHLLPFYIPIPILAALFWICIVQKNRASKLLITLDEELFKIRYLQGLLLAINKLSTTQELAIKRINDALERMLDSYLHKIEHQSLTERMQSWMTKESDAKDCSTLIREFIETLKELK